MFDALEGTRTIVSWANRSVGVPSCPAPPRPAADSPMVCPGFGLDKSNCHGARKCGFGAKPGPKRTSCSGRAQQGICARRDYRRVIRPSNRTIIPRRTPAGALDAHLTPRGRVGYLQRDCYAQLYCIPRQTRAGILDAQLESKAYLGVQNHTPLDRDRRTKTHRNMQCHHHTQNNRK